MTVLESALQEMYDNKTLLGCVLAEADEGAADDAKALYESIEKNGVEKTAAIFQESRCRSFLVLRLLIRYMDKNGEVV